MATGNTKKTTTRKPTTKKTTAKTATKQPAKNRSKTRTTASKTTTKQEPPIIVAQRNAVSSKIMQEVIILGGLAISIILFLANFGFGGIVGEAISSFFFGLFGLLAYIFPIILFVGILFAVSNQYSLLARVKIITAIFTILFICTFIQLASGHHAFEWEYLDYYYQSSFHKNGGGFFGGILCKALTTWFGVVGAFVIDLVLIIIGLVLITEKSFINGIKKSGNKVYNTAKNDMEQYREEVAVRKIEKNEQRQLRMQKKIKGVSLDTEIPKNNGEEESYEILPNEIVPDESNTESIYRFQKAEEIDIQQEEKTEDLPYYEQEIRHYEEEQSSPFEVTSDEKDDVYIDMELVQKEFEQEESQRQHFEQEKELQETKVQEMEVQESHQTSEDATDENKVYKSNTNHKATKGTRKKKYVFPPIKLLKKGMVGNKNNFKEDLRATANKLQQTLANFGVMVTVTDVSCGPSVTRYEIQPEQGVKVSKIVSLSDDIKLNLAAADIRIEAPIPGKAAVGIEVPNKEMTGVLLGDLLSSPEFKKNQSPIAFAAGKDIAGKTMIADIAKMPHLLIAGATGSGKSVCINTIVMSILYQANPRDVKLIMIDPKVVELSVYNGIPHLMIPVVTDPKKAAGALNWAVAEMTDRYQKFADSKVRDIKSYNEKIEGMEDEDQEQDQEQDQEIPEKLPQVVIIIDELADLMMVASNEVEDAIVRLAQLARAAGIHLVIATQRPSVNVITGLIKANVPSRIAFSVSSGVDSRTIIDMNGAEKLLGKGDMLFYPQGFQKPVRVQGAFVSDEEVSAVVDFLKEHNEESSYREDVKNKINNPGFAESQTFGGDRDQYFMEAGKFIIEKERASIGMLQRVYKIGFNRAARIMDQLCEAGVVGPEEGTKPRKVIMNMEEFTEFLNNN